MDQERPVPARIRGPRSRLPLGFRDLLDALLSHATRDDSTTAILDRICTSLLRFSGCDALSIRLETEGKTTCCRKDLTQDGLEGLESVGRPGTAQETGPGLVVADLIPEPILQAVLSKGVAAPTQSCTRGGSFWTGDTARPILLRAPDEGGRATRTVVIGGEYPSLAVIPILVNDRSRGVLCLASRRRDWFSREDIQPYETVAQTLGVALAHQGAQWALRERVKELTCLYGIAEVAGRPGISLDQILAEIVDLLPPGWQYPDITQARITLDGRGFSTTGFGPGLDRQTAEILVRDVARGLAEVVYTERMPEMDEGPFLKEERSLINEVARQVGAIVDRWEAEEERRQLQEQLRHAERLATIGQLSAGVAHELNEPLGVALGFGELVKQSPALPAALGPDVDRIIKAALHAREIIRKLMIFTRQMPIRRVPSDLNHVVGEGLYFLESRCVKEGVVLRAELAEGLPLVMADPAQLQQVLVNLVVNAIQAMPDGGTLTVKTHATQGGVALVVRDTGTGMSPDVQQRLFTPFFTTKDVGQGTGLGLAVVHGIVTGHGGTLHVHSEVGRGSSFEVRIPAGAVAQAIEEC